jgi:hypothetical protein
VKYAPPRVQSLQLNASAADLIRCWVTAELEEWYQAGPWRTPREFLERVQVKYPGRYADGLIRTVQRRIKIWRGARARELTFGPFADAEPSNADTHTQRRAARDGLLRFAARHLNDQRPSGSTRWIFREHSDEMTGNILARQWHPRLGTSTDEAIREPILIVGPQFGAGVLGPFGRGTFGCGKLPSQVSPSVA